MVRAEISGSGCGGLATDGISICAEARGSDWRLGPVCENAAWRPKRWPHTGLSSGWCFEAPPGTLNDRPSSSQRQHHPFPETPYARLPRPVSTFPALHAAAQQCQAGQSLTLPASSLSTLGLSNYCLRKQRRREGRAKRETGECGLGKWSGERGVGRVGLEEMERM